MKVEDIVTEWDKDSKIDETELGNESVKIPNIHNKYLKIFLAERVTLFKLKAERNRLKRKLLEYYLGEMGKEELAEIDRDQIYKKILKNEVDVYIDSDDLMVEMTLKVAVQEEKVNYIESIIKSINNRGFQIKNAIDWAKFTMG